MLRFLSFYGMIALTYLFVQIALSHREYLNQVKREETNYYPSVAVVIPSYNEDKDNVLGCVNSCLNQDYKKPIKIYFIDDGSKDKSAVNELKKIKDERLIIIDNKENKGKREAQKCAFDLIGDDTEIICTVDSDARLEKKAVFYLVQNFLDKKVGAVTGNVRGASKNFLSRLINLRYFTAFNQERGAQSYFGVVLCCCGVASCYLNKIVQKVKEEYTNQYFLNIKQSFGDDRNLTNLVLREGFLVKYECKALVVTSVPLNLKSWLKQQIRWNKSFYRELIYTFKFMFKKPKSLPLYIWYDLTIQTLLPFMLLFSIGLMIFNTFFSGIIFLLGYLAVLVGVSLIRGIYAYFRTGEKGFFLFPAYSFLHVFLLIPLRFYSVCTLKNTNWGTRNINQNEIRQYSKI